MATAYPLPTAATPVERILSRFDRKQLADFIEVAISLLDVANDPDVEDDDPAEDGDISEDDDPGEDSDSDRCLAGDDWVGDGAVVIHALGFCDGSSLYDVGADEDMEPLAPLTLNPDPG